MRWRGPSTGFLVVLGGLLSVVAVAGLLASAGCEDVGSECHPGLPKVGVAALVLAIGTFGYAFARNDSDHHD
jgi:hypothetical protein